MKKLILAVLGIVMLSSNAFAQDCFESSIISPSPFMGHNEEIFKLNDGSMWEVTYEYEYLYEYYPSVIVCPDRGKLYIGEKSLNIKLVSTGKRRSASGSSESSGWELIEDTNLQGTISGTVQQGRIFKTTSGSIYEVTGSTLQLVLELQPSVTVLSNGEVFKLIVEGFDEPLICNKLK